MNKQWEKDIKTRLAAHEEPAPELSWTEIDAALAERRKAARTPIIYMWPRRIAVAAAVATLIGGAGLLFLHNTDKSNDKPIVSHTGGNGKEQPAPSPLMADNTQKNMAEATQKAEPLQHAKANSKVETSSFEPSENSEVIGNSDKSELSENSKPSQKSANPTSLPKKKSLDEGIAFTSATKKQAPRLMAQAWLGGGASSNEGLTTDQVMVGADAPFANYTPNNMQNGVTEQAPTPSDEPTHVHHHTPLRFGLGVRYRLSDRWSLATGLTYTYLSSDLDYNDGREGKQRLHYVGIPLQLSYTVWKAKRTHVYVSAGGEVQKMVAGRCTVHTESFGEATPDTKETLTIHPLQLSATVAAGVEYAFAKRLALYAEPGLGYHFDNGSDVPTLYQDKPVNFNLNIGLRFNIK